jgi:hypothetical protein
MNEELPELVCLVVSILWNQETDTVSVDCEGLNRMEVLGLMHVALEQLSDEAYWWSSECETEDEE